MIESVRNSMPVDSPPVDMLLKEENGKFFLDGDELPADHPEEWGSIIISRMAKRYLKDG